jgi:hypothetical protein
MGGLIKIHGISGACRVCHRHGWRTEVNLDGALGCFGNAPHKTEGALAIETWNYDLEKCRRGRQWCKKLNQNRLDQYVTWY